MWEICRFGEGIHVTSEVYIPVTIGGTRGGRAAAKSKPGGGEGLVDRSRSHPRLKSAQ